MDETKIDSDLILKPIENIGIVDDREILIRNEQAMTNGDDSLIVPNDSTDTATEGINLEETKNQISKSDYLLDHNINNLSSSSEIYVENESFISNELPKNNNDNNSIIPNNSNNVDALLIPNEDQLDSDANNITVSIPEEETNESEGSFSIPNEIQSEMKKIFTKAYDDRYVSWAWPYIFLIVGTVLYYLIKMNYNWLPEPITIDEAIKNPELFSGQRASMILKNLTSIGERVVGSEANEIHTPIMILDALEQIQRDAHPSQNIMFEIQSGDGAYNINSQKSFTYVYHGIKNVVAQLEGDGGHQMMLVNCHYDSVPSSVGASDDGGSCAVMLEILRALSSRDERLCNDVVFLFNGAEEPAISGSHLFSQHRWSADVYAVINMEGMGGGGVPFLFSTYGSEWLFNYHAVHANFPRAQVFADELYDSGVIPSMTDLVIFEQFGIAAALDFAFVGNGYIHHSKYDMEEYISTSSLQAYGENILETIVEYSDNLMPHNNDLFDAMVFYDYLGWFMIYYTKYTGNFANLLTAIASIVTVAIFSYKNFTIMEIIFSALASLLGMILGFGVNISVALFMDNVPSLAMTFFSNTHILVPLYWFPCIVAFSIPPLVMDIWRLKNTDLNITKQTQLNLVSYQIPWAIMLIVFTSMGIRSAHILFVTLVATCISNFIIHMIKQISDTKYVWIWLYLILILPSIFYQMYLCLIINSIFIPLLGRAGSVNADLIMALISAMSALLVTAPILPLLTLVRKRFYTLLIFFAVTILTIVLVSLTPLGFPYKKGPSDPAPQRFFIMHTHRNYFTKNQTNYKDDVGFLLLDTDRNTFRSIPYKWRDNAMIIDDTVDELSYSFIPRLSTYGDTNTWISIEANPNTTYPKLAEDLQLFDITKDCPHKEHCTVSFNIRGADRMTLYLLLEDGVSLFSCSLPTEIYHDTWHARPVYYIFLIMGEVSTIELTFHFIISKNQEIDSLMQVGLAGYATHHEELRNKELLDFIGVLPDYSTVTAWNCLYNQYII